MTEANEHEWAVASIPWHVNGTLSEADARRLKLHVDSCPGCRQDLAIEMGLARQLAAQQAVEYAPQASFARLMKRLDRPTPLTPRKWFRRWSDATEGRRGAVSFVIAAQAAALILLAITLFWVMSARDKQTTYALAGGPVQTLPHLQIIFDDGIAANQILAIVGKVDGTVISGPSNTGVYLIGVDGGADTLNTAARRLQENPAVRFVAVVQAPEGP